MFGVFEWLPRPLCVRERVSSHPQPPPAAFLITQFKSYMQVVKYEYGEKMLNDTKFLGFATQNQNLERGETSMTLRTFKPTPDPRFRWSGVDDLQPNMAEGAWMFYPLFHAVFPRTRNHAQFTRPITQPMHGTAIPFPIAL